MNQQPQSSTEYKMEGGTEVLAKRVDTKHKTFYYVKGSRRIAQLYNPVDPNFHMGTNGAYNLTWDFVIVTQSVFDMYVKFIDTKKNTFYVAAQRLFRN